ncbi:hypothetical protein MRX96_055000 [Rhipicephalus microplus]
MRTADGNGVRGFSRKKNFQGQRLNSGGCILVVVHERVAARKPSQSEDANNRRKTCVKKKGIFVTTVVAVACLKALGFGVCKLAQLRRFNEISSG